MAREGVNSFSEESSDVIILDDDEELSFVGPASGGFGINTKLNTNMNTSEINAMEKDAKDLLDSLNNWESDVCTPPKKKIDLKYKIEPEIIQKQLGEQQLRYEVLGLIGFKEFRAVFQTNDNKYELLTRYKPIELLSPLDPQEGNNINVLSSLDCAIFNNKVKAVNLIPPSTSKSRRRPSPIIKNSLVARKQRLLNRTKMRGIKLNNRDVRGSSGNKKTMSNETAGKQELVNLAATKVKEKRLGGNVREEESKKIVGEDVSKRTERDSVKLLSNKNVSVNNMLLRKQKLINKSKMGAINCLDLNKTEPVRRATKRRQQEIISVNFKPEDVAERTERVPINNTVVAEKQGGETNKSSVNEVPMKSLRIERLFGNVYKRTKVETETSKTGSSVRVIVNLAKEHSYSKKEGSTCKDYIQTNQEPFIHLTNVSNENQCKPKQAVTVDCKTGLFKDPPPLDLVEGIAAKLVSTKSVQNMEKSMDSVCRETSKIHEKSKTCRLGRYVIEDHQKVSTVKPTLELNSGCTENGYSSVQENLARQLKCNLKSILIKEDASASTSRSITDSNKICINLSTVNNKPVSFVKPNLNYNPASLEKPNLNLMNQKVVKQTNAPFISAPPVLLNGATTSEYLKSKPVLRLVKNEATTVPTAYGFPLMNVGGSIMIKIQDKLIPAKEVFTKPQLLGIYSQYLKNRYKNCGSTTIIHGAPQGFSKNNSATQDATKTISNVQNEVGGDVTKRTVEMENSKGLRGIVQKDDIKGSTVTVYPTTNVQTRNGDVESQLVTTLIRNVESNVQMKKTTPQTLKAYPLPKQTILNNLKPIQSKLQRVDLT